MNVSDKVLEVETEIDIEKITVKKYGQSFQIYPWLKVRLFHKSMMGKDVLIEKSKSVLFSQIKSLSYGFFNLFRKYDSWVFSNSSERTLIEGKYYDKLFDYIGNNSGLKTLIIELQLFQKFKRKDVASKYVVSKAIFILLEEIYGRFFIRKISIENKNLIEDMEVKLNCKVDVDAIVRKNLAQYRLMKFWLFILPNPKTVFLTVHYSNFGYIRAFKEKGIKVIEMQHGLIGEGHYAYFYKKAFDTNQFPDEICVFGNNEKLFFETKTVFPVKLCQPIGSFVLDYFNAKSLQNHSISKICVSLQDGDFGEQLLDFLLKANEYLTKKFTFIIQPRRTSEAFYREKFSFPENFIFSKQSIYEAISQSDIHITIFSTTAIEALSIGKQNILVNIGGKSKEFLAHQLAENKFTFFVDSVSEFCETINNLKFVEKEIIATSNSNNIKSNYKKNIKDLIEGL